MYSAEFLYIYKRVGKGLPKSLVANTLVPEKVGVANRAAFYKPIRFDVKVAHSSASSRGLMRIEVPVRENDEWYAHLKERLCKTLELPPVASNSIEIIDSCRRSIENMHVDRLARAGPLEVIYHGGVKRLAEMPKAPEEYSTRKPETIAVWLQGVCAGLPEVVASMLTAQSGAGINEACQPGGPIQTKIQEIVRAQTFRITGKSWNEFVRVSAHNSPANVSDDVADFILTQVSESLLASLQNQLRASDKKLRAYDAAMQAKRLASRADQHEHGSRHKSLYDPVFGSVGSAAHQDVSIEHGHKMYRKIVRHAVRNPGLKRDVGTLLFRQQFNNVACHNKQKNRDDDNNYSYYDKNVVMDMGDYKRKKQRRGTEILVLKPKAWLKKHPQEHKHHHESWEHPHHHPYWTMVHSMSRPIYGTTPAYYKVHGTRKNLTEMAPYVGDEVETWQKYHMFLGLQACPPAIKLSARVETEKPRAPKVVPIERNVKQEKEEEEKKEKEKEEYPELETCLETARAISESASYVTRSARRLLDCSQNAAQLINLLPKNKRALVKNAATVPSDSLISIDHNSRQYVSASVLPSITKHDVELHASKVASFVENALNALNGISERAPDVIPIRELRRQQQQLMGEESASVLLDPLRRHADNAAKEEEDVIQSAPKIIPISASGPRRTKAPIVSLPNTAILVSEEEEEDDEAEWVDDLPTIEDILRQSNK